MTGSDCRRTQGLIDRVVDGTVTPDDRAHAAGCSSCGPVLDRAARFDDELRRTAQRLVVEDLPRGILDPTLESQLEGARRTRAFLPGFATAFAAVTILILATAVSLVPGGFMPTPSPLPSKAAGPPFRTTLAIVADAVELEYRCNDGLPLATSGPGAGLAVRESAVCTAPRDIGPFMAAIIVGESAAGEVVTVSLKANLIGPDNATNRASVAAALAKLAALAYKDAADGLAAGDFVVARLPNLEPPVGEATTAIGGVHIRVEHLDDGAWIISMELLDPS
jgi:hypothetical protein